MKTSRAVFLMAGVLIVSGLWTSRVLAQFVNPFLDSNGHPRRTETADILLLETKDGLVAYSKPQGKWVPLSVAMPEDGKSRVQHSLLQKGFAYFMNKEELFGFSSRACRWSKLTIPEEFVGKVQPLLSLDLLTVTFGDQTFVLSPITGEWESPDGKVGSSPKPIGADTFDPQSDYEFSVPVNRNKRVPSSDANEPMPAAQNLNPQITEKKERASFLAQQIRTQAAKFGANHSSVIEANQELVPTLDALLDLKFQQEQVRIKELQLRLVRLQNRIEQHRAERVSIVQHIANELILGHDTIWGQSIVQNSNPVNGPSNHRPPDSVSQFDFSIHTVTVPSTKEADTNSADVRDVPAESRSTTSIPGTPSSITRDSDALQVQQQSAPRLELQHFDVSIQEFATKLTAARRNVRDARVLVLECEKDAKIDPGDDAKNNLLVAQEKLEDVVQHQDLLREQYAATSRDLKLQVKSAKLDLDVANLELEKLNSADAAAREAGRESIIGELEIAKSKRRSGHAMITLERLQNRLDLFDKFGTGLNHDVKSEPTVPTFNTKGGSSDGPNSR